ncbi:hypothetical protein [Bacillus velezensis]|uniref:hypothetical protein n=1 Tax=Bacillus velezensis TaxID=492670 RepID=UPI0009F2F3CA|nr:hypothetical protein [Bacillus velezensis]OQV53372.1 hypothetical protein B5Z20_03395 [Bacillus velezensis]OQV55395.1 hypothetical protein B5Z22_08260 [Bacillus velezensis]OQV60886.1 hypothetical protein B5Z24_08265 [Bacillus velezensis]OQV61953.1 hypothetical protein B5Z23_08250 [Bacillus velezensis]
MEVELNGKNLDDLYIKAMKGGEGMTETNANIHVLADETLGGIKREYVEVDRKAIEGESIVIVGKKFPEDVYNNGDIFTVDRDFHSEMTFVESDEAISAEYNCSGLIYHEEYRVLEPTDIVHIDGERYEMADRKAEVGEKIIVTSSDTFPEGFIAEVDFLDDFYEDSSFYLTKGIGGNFYLDSSDDLYRVLVPIKDAEDEPKPADPIDVIANLAQEVASLKRTVDRHKDEIDTLYKDKRTLGEELARLKDPVKAEECASVDAPLVFVQRKIGNDFEVYQDGKRLRGIRSIRIDASAQEFTTHMIEYVSGATEEAGL